MTEAIANRFATTLSAGVNNSTTTIPLTSVTGAPSGGNWRLLVDDEIMLVTSVASLNATVTRGAEGTTAAAHSSGAAATHVLTAASLVAVIADNSGAGSGTSFPGSPTSGDRYYRSDRNLLYFYNGTRWLTVDLYLTAFGSSDTQPFSATATAGRLPPLMQPDYDAWLETVYWSSFVVGTNNGGNYWEMQLRYWTAGTPTNIVTADTTADSPDVYARHKTAINALLGSHDALDVAFIKHSGAGSAYIGALLAFRLVG